MMKVLENYADNVVREIFHASVIKDLIGEHV